MSASVAQDMRERVARIETTPAIPAVLVPLLKVLNRPAEDVDISEVVRLVSYDNSIAAQCMRMASSPLFGLAQQPKSVSSAVVSLGLHRVESILLTSCMGHAFPTKSWPLEPAAFWRHSLGCAMVCRRFSEQIGSSDTEKAYTAGLLHDIGIMANCVAFPGEFALVVEKAREAQQPLLEAELSVMGFTHCDTGQVLAERWGLAEEIFQVIAFHHDVQRASAARGLVAIVHLSDLLCRMRDLGYGYYECSKVDMIADPAWAILKQEHPELERVDLARFTFELDESVSEISEIVRIVLGSSFA